MLFFKKILNFSPDAMAGKEKRRNSRFQVGQGFPVKATLQLPAKKGENAQNWGGWLLNLSPSGASMQLHPAALTKSGEPCGFTITFDNVVLEMAGRIAHFRTYPNYTVCGVALVFTNNEIKKAFLQLLEPVMVGSSFKPVDSKRVKQDTPDLKKEQYSGDSDTRLTVWRLGGGTTIAGFDLQFGTFSVAGSSDSPLLDVSGLEKANEAELNAAKEELIRLFHWIVPNLSKSVPADVRKFLSRF